MASQLDPTLKALSKPVSIGEPVVQSTSDGDFVVINVVFAAVSIDFQFMVMPDGRIGGLFLRPVQSPVVHCTFRIAQGILPNAP